MPDSPMKKPRRELHITNGPTFSAYMNRWGADCSCGWKASHRQHGVVLAAIKLARADHG